MAFFSNTASSTTSPGERAQTSETIITSCMEIHGDIRGCGSLYIDGTLHGNIETEEGVTVGRDGKVYGEITTRKLIVSGTIEGRVACEDLEVTQTGVVSDTIRTHTLRSDGTLTSNIEATDAIEISANGRVETTHMESRRIVVSGSVVGNLTATELLEIEQTGRIEGEMTVTRFKVAEGGTVMGQMRTYQPDAPITAPEPMVDTTTLQGDEEAIDA